MLCIKCGANVNEGDNFCEECGASLKQPAFPKSTIILCDNNLAAVTNIGRRHPTNEDSGTVLKGVNADSFLIIADGVSSSVGAVSASQKAVEIIKEALMKSHVDSKELIASAIHSADDCIKNLPFETREGVVYGPETTVVTALVRGGMITIGWVGDSRAYVINKDKQQLLTVDDSWIEMVVADGSMSREQAVLDRRAHCVTQVLGMHDQEAEVHIIECEFQKGDMLLLCSDGLWNYFQGENALLNAISTFGIKSDAASICEYLTGLANAAGGHDNITAALLKNL